MRAVRVHEFGPPSVLRVEDVPRPAVQAGEALVRVAAAGLNPSDLKNVAGLFPQTKPLRTPGRDFAGTVVEGPAEWAGAAVFGTGGDIGFTRDGSHAEFVVVPVGALVRKPAAWTDAAAAVAGLVYVTAATAIGAAKLSGTDTVLVIGPGGTGTAAIQMAKWRGHRVLAATRRREQGDEVRRLGADDVIVLADGPLPDAVRALTGGRGVDVVIDTVGGPLFEPGLLSLADGGRLVEMSAPPADKRVGFDLLQFYRRRLSVIGINTADIPATGGGQILRSLSAGFDAGLLRPAADVRTFPLDQAVAAYEAVGHGGGKVAITTA